MKMQTLCLAMTVLAAVILLAARSSATCNDASLTGVWGYVVGASAGQFTTDGAGNITSGTQTSSQGGTIVTDTLTGTYSVATACTGTITLNFTGGGTGTANFVLDLGHKGAQVISTEGGSVADGFSLAEGTVTCGLTGIKHTFALAVLGKNSVGPVAYVAQVTLNGTGKVSGSGTFDVNGTITHASSFAGTYTETAECTGSMQLTGTGVGTLNFNFVVVSSGKELLLIETDSNTGVAGNMQQ